MASINSIMSTNSSKNGIVADFSSMEEGKHGNVQSPFMSAFQKVAFTPHPPTHIKLLKYVYSF